MSYIIRPYGDSDLSKATLHPGTSLPQTITSLGAGVYDVGRIDWCPTMVSVTGTGGSLTAGPSVVGTLPLIPLPTKSGVRDIPAAQVFGGDGLTYSLRGAAPSVTIASATGVISVDTDRHDVPASLSFDMVATNSAGEASAPANVVLGPRLGISVGSDALRYMNDAVLGAALDDMAAIGCTSLRFDLDWSLVQATDAATFDWTEPDRVINAATARGIGILPILNFTPGWARSVPTARTCPPVKLSDFANFCSAAVQRYQSRGIRIWEVWNEPNLDNFWKPTPDPAVYAAMLDAAYVAIKAADPGALVISAGLASVPTTDTQSPARYMAVEEFLNRMYDRSPRFDVLGFHPYSWPLMPSDPAAWNGWNLMTNKVRGIMQSRGDAAKPVWMTEFGAPTNAAGGGVTEAAQAQMLQEAVSLAGNHAWAGPLYWYSYADRGVNPNDTEDWFGLVRQDRSPKLAHSVFKSLSSTAVSAASAQLHFDASVSGTIVASGGQVSEWRSSASATTAFRSAASANVTYGSRRVGASDAVDFSGTGFTAAGVPQMSGSVWSKLVDLNFGASPWSLFLAFVVDDPTGTNCVVTHIGDGGSSTGPDTILQISRRASEFRVACNGAANSLPTSLVPLGTLKTVLVTWSGTEARCSIDGAAPVSLSVGMNAATTPTWTLGGTLASPDNNRLDGAIMTVLADQAVIDSGRHDALRAQVLARWG